MTAAVQIILPTAPLGSRNAITSVADLRAVDSTDVTANTEVLVADQGFFRFDPSSLATDNGTTIIKPTDRTTLQAGRWIMVLLANADQVAASLPGFPAIVKTIGDALPYINPSEFFGIKSDGSTDDTVALAAAILAISNNSKGPGGILSMRPAAETITSAETIVRPYVKLNIGGGKISAHLNSGNDAALTPMSYTDIGHGKVQVYSSGAPGTQAGAHAPIRVGAPAGATNTPSAPHELEGSHHIKLHNLILESNKNVVTVDYPDGGGAVGIMLYGGVNNVDISLIEIPDNAYMLGGIGGDWIQQGAIVSAAASMAANKLLYDAGTGLTVAPHDIRVAILKIGALTKPCTRADLGSWGVRFSGTRGVKVNGVQIKSVTSAPLIFTAGDLGLEFASVADRALGITGNEFRNITMTDAIVGNLIGSDLFGGNLAVLDSRADNVAAAVTGYAYTSMVDPIYKVDLIVDALRGRGTAGANANEGIRCTFLRGALITRSIARGFKHGVLVDEGCKELAFRGNTATGNRLDGFRVEHNTTLPEDIELTGNTANSNGTSGTNSAGIFLGSCKRVSVCANKFGLAGAYDLSQVWNIRAAGTISDLNIGGSDQGDGRNVHFSTKQTTGVAESILSTSVSDYGKLCRYAPGIMVDAAKINSARAGIDFIPLKTTRGSDNINRGDYLTTAAVAATLTGGTHTGTFVAGETAKVEATGAIVKCSAGGTPGTWA